MTNNRLPTTRSSTHTYIFHITVIALSVRRLTADASNVYTRALWNWTLLNHSGGARISTQLVIIITARRI